MCCESSTKNLIGQLGSPHLRLEDFIIRVAEVARDLHFNVKISETDAA